MRNTAADERERKLDAELQALATAGDWDGVVAALDRVWQTMAESP